MLDVHGADHRVVEVEHREPRVARLAGELDDRPGAVVGLQAHGAHARRHDLARGPGAELDRALHQLGRLGVQGPLVGGP